MLDNSPEHYDFSTEDVLKKTPIKYVGSATSDFQAEPLVYDDKGKRAAAVSDWEIELAKNLEGKDSGIKERQDPRQFPRFLKNKELYIGRSAELGENMFRFSLDFARLCPKEGEFNNKLMAEYAKVLALSRARGQEPMLTLYHWPMPKYLLMIDDGGGIRAGAWEHPEAIKHFRFYVKNVVSFLNNKDNIREVVRDIKLDNVSRDRMISVGLVRYFISLNEPINLVLPTYIMGKFPPFKKWRFDIIPKILDKLVTAHDIAFEEIKKMKFIPGNGGSHVGVAHHHVYFDGVFGGIFRFLNESITQKIERNGEHTDFLGIQYYFRKTVPLLVDRGRAYSDHPTFGDIYPRGIYDVLGRMHDRYPKKNILITEFGFSDRNDERRPYWILETMRYVFTALRRGVPVKGVLFWTLANNFEWLFGIQQKFGLFNESELGQPLTATNDGVRSWEAWQAVIDAIRNPSEKSLSKLQKCYERARTQCDRAEKALG